MQPESKPPTSLPPLSLPQPRRDKRIRAEKSCSKCEKNPKPHKANRSTKEIKIKNQRAFMGFSLSLSFSLCRFHWEVSRFCFPVIPSCNGRENLTNAVSFTSSVRLTAHEILTPKKLLVTRLAFQRVLAVGSDTDDRRKDRRLRTKPNGSFFFFPLF